MKVSEYKTTQEYDLDLAAGRVDLVIASVNYLKVAHEKPGNSNVVLARPQINRRLLGRGLANKPV
ncbi:hypothetical protein [Sodalis-like endosymbiont of Proechinophthirus fluctus]|uniref:hypothetical protein n=1 Tax=Sodalis-like endosymbiont of Proechinophthirus fluctus TaxID=1462730 RepID=UPI001FCC5B94|nr:hypothetical protein [Sodalis-like endosymbiont of Proechinophthirus fluctus]